MSSRPWTLVMLAIPSSAFHRVSASVRKRDLPDCASPVNRGSENYTVSQRTSAMKKKKASQGKATYDSQGQNAIDQKRRAKRGCRVTVHVGQKDSLVEHLQARMVPSEKQGDEMGDHLVAVCDPRPRLRRHIQKTLPVVSHHMRFLLWTHAQKSIFCTCKPGCI